MKLSRHFVCYDGVRIHRRLFSCRECGKPCSPSRYKPYNKSPVLKIATSYGCGGCDVNFVTTS